MGAGITVKCLNCAYEKTFYTGIGFGFPDEYKKLVRKVRGGAFGKEWKNFFETHPGAVIDGDRELYQCPACHALEDDHNLALYDHREGNAPEHGYWMRTDESRKEYLFVKSRFHKCQRCGKRMHAVQDFCVPLPCPECGSEMELGNLLLWD